ncbi:UTP--glucose-1-phosphate uridylyltransferase [Pseudaestuariivita atlantica]|uniref:UTP--glucose-1-phosphate uridylyltransferase n=1 Tax=Pseudaestuariivita atlantica TaxID=1317121 RepID=A0A0L1JJG3_9RHOB|nr:UTP--glucose-1-phosphate uridylyltransferase [Pseudaestuariivita atlantica]KNG91900.1 UTP--glucose-1-phosphate uridylyltransferase [Pseudaestuariivita atlantica]
MTRRSNVTKAVFPVAGLGTRFLPATKSIPKEILPLVDRPLIQYAIDEARAAGIEEFIFVTARGRTTLKDYLDPAPCLSASLKNGNKTDLLAELERTHLPAHSVTFAYQDEPLGLGHAIWCARDLIGNDSFAVILPDDVIASATPCLQQMVEVYPTCGGTLLAAMEVGPESVGSYGILDAVAGAGPLRAVNGMVEKPDPQDAPSNLAVVGRYILHPSVLDHLSRAKPGAGGEIQLTDAIAGEIGRTGVHGYQFAGQRYDCGSKAGYLRATVAFALERPDLHEDFADCLADVARSRIAAE